MLAWAMRRPPYALKIGPTAIAWTSVDRNWRGRCSVHSVVSPLPDGVVRPSPVEPNVTNPAMLQERIQRLVGMPGEVRLFGRVLAANLPCPITLILPDLAVRSVILRFDQLPGQAQERDALIRWKLGQEQLLPITGMRISYQVLDPAHRTGKSLSVLTVAVQESVLGQYESLCRDVNLIPVEVDVASLRLFNLWSRLSGGTGRWSNDFMWVSQGDGGLTVFVFHEGQMVFVRTKLLSSTVAERDGRSHRPEPTRVVDECVASLLACQQLHPQLALQTIIFVGDAPDSPVRGMLENASGLRVQELDWRRLQRYGWRPGANQAAAGLPTLATAV